MCPTSRLFPTVFCIFSMTRRAPAPCVAPQRACMGQQFVSLPPLEHGRILIHEESASRAFGPATIVASLDRSTGRTRAAERHGQTLRRKVVRHAFADAQSSLHAGSFLHIPGMPRKVSIFARIELRAGDTKPNPVDVGIRDRPVLAEPPLIFSKPSVN